MANSTVAKPAYVIPVWETITAAWDKTNGAKGTIWAALGIVILISIAFGFIEGLTKNVAFINGLLTLIGNIILYFLQMGLLYIGIRRAAGIPIEWKMVFNVVTDFNKALWVVAAYLIMFIIYIPAIILVAIGIFLLTTSTSGLLAILCFIASFIAFIYLAARLILMLPYVLDTGMNAWEAAKLSFAATKDNVLPIIGILLLQMIILAVSAIPLGIGLIWTLPFAVVLFGLMYQRLRVNA